MAIPFRPGAGGPRRAGPRECQKVTVTLPYVKQVYE